MSNGLSTPFLDLRRAQQECPLSRRKFQQLIKEGRLRAFRFDGKIIVRRDDIEQLLTASPVGADLEQSVNQTLADLESGK